MPALRSFLSPIVVRRNYKKEMPRWNREKKEEMLKEEKERERELEKDTINNIHSV